MEHEPIVETPREPEALLVVVDTSTTSEQCHNELRDIATRLARTRLIYTVSKDDLIAVVKAGSAHTANPLAEQTGEGYPGIEVLHAPSTRSLAAVNKLVQLQPGGNPSNLLDILDVCGDALSSPAAERCSKKRIVLFTDGESIIGNVQSSDIPDFCQTCQLYLDHGIQVDVVCYCSDQVIDDYNKYDDEVQEMESIKDITKIASNYEKGILFAMTKVTSGIFLSSKEASHLAEMPTPKVKKATAKYAGILNIADMLRIPVKRYSYVNEAKPTNGKIISWKSSCQQDKMVSVLKETQRVASTKDGTSLEKDDIVNAYPYGPELVPEQNEVDTYAWHMHMEQGLDVIAFVNQDSVPQHLFLSSVDVIIPMPSAPGAADLLQPIVLGMQAEKLGILARSVMNPKGGAPSLAYLWPRVEVDRNGGHVKNCFLFIVNIPMKDDIRRLPFANLEESLGHDVERATEAMNNFIDVFTLDKPQGKNIKEEDVEEDDEDDEEEFWPSSTCNPSLDWFNISVVHRALSGVSGTDFPQRSRWHDKLLNPLNYLDQSKHEKFDEVISRLKISLPVVHAPPKRKRPNRVIGTRDGEMVSLVHYLPPDENEESETVEVRDSGEVVEKQVLEDFGDVMSTVTGASNEDIDVDSPVSDFWSLVQKGKFRFAAVSLLVIIRRLIREVDDEKAIQCLIALRKASAERKDIQIFNDFILTLILRCEKEDVLANRTRAFLKYVGRQKQVPQTLELLPLPENSEPDKSSGRLYHERFLASQQRDLKAIIAGHGDKSSVSNITGSIDY